MEVTWWCNYNYIEATFLNIRRETKMKIGKHCYTDPLWRPNGRSRVAVNGYIDYSPTSYMSAKERVMWASLTKTARKKGYKPGWVYYKFKEYQAKMKAPLAL